jgi:hypothetical protein
MKQKVLLITNTLTLVFALVMNALTGSELFNGITMADISERYETLFTPAGYAFSIWGLIYLLLLLFTGYQWYTYIKFRQDEHLNRTGIWFAVSNLANGLWVAAFLSDAIGLSVLIMLILLLSLIMLTVRLRLEIWDAPVRIIAFVWWPICIYTGWIIVATVANVSTFLVSINWQGGTLSQEAWTVIMIVAALMIYLLLIYYRNMREAAAVGIWGLVAIASKQWQLHQPVVVAALAAAVVLLVAVSVHGYLNRETSPGKKIARGEI